MPPEPRVRKVQSTSKTQLSAGKALSLAAGKFVLDADKMR